MEQPSGRLHMEAYLVEIAPDGDVQRVRLPNVPMGDLESLAALHDIIALWTIS